MRAWTPLLATALEQLESRVIHAFQRDEVALAAGSDSLDALPEMRYVAFPLSDSLLALRAQHLFANALLLRGSACAINRIVK